MTQRLDWERARRQLEEARLALSEELSPHDERELLAERARLLASPPAGDGRENGAWRDVIVFAICGERFAVDAEHVLEALPIGEPTAVPGTPELLLGVVNHRGRVLPVMDLRRQLVPGGERAGELTHAVAVEIEGMVFGIAAEAVEETGRERARTLEQSLVTVLDLEALAADPLLRIDDD